MEPSLDPGEIRDRQALTTEMADALASGLTPPFGGLHDIRPMVRRAQVGGSLDPEELSGVVETLKAIANLATWLDRVGDEFPRLGGMRRDVGQFDGVANAIESCIDERGKILDTASRRLSALRARDGAGRGPDQGNPDPDAPLERDQAHPPLSQLHDGRPPLRPADRQGASGRDPGVGPPDQRQQRDRLRRAPGHRRAIGPALVPPLEGGQGDPPDPPMAQRPGRPGRRVAARHARNPRRTRPDLRPGPLQPRLPPDPARLQPRRQAQPPRGPASAPRSPLPPTRRTRDCRTRGLGDRADGRASVARRAEGRSRRSTSTSGSSSRRWSSPGRTRAGRRSP